MGNIVGLGNFLGGVAQGYQQMAKLNQDKERLLLEAEMVDQRKTAMAQDADQFAQYQTLQREKLAQDMGLSEKAFADAAAERAFRRQEAAEGRKFNYGLFMEESRERGRDRLAASKPTMKDALLRSYLESDLLPQLPAEQQERIRGLLPAMLGRPGSTGGATATEGLGGAYNFYRGGILTGLGQ